MSAPLKTNTPAPSTSKHDWACATMDKLKSSLDDKPEVYDVKVGECKQHQQAKREVKEREVREHQQREEVERQAREEAVCLEREAGGGRSPGLGGVLGKRRERVSREGGCSVLGSSDQEGDGDGREEGPGGHGREAGRGSEEDPGAKETARQWEEAEASKQKPVVMKKWVREENAVARPSGMPGPQEQVPTCLYAVHEAQGEV